MTSFIRPRPSDTPELRVIVFHHAGGSAAAYYPIARELPAEWDVALFDLPGRGKRHSEAPISDMKQLIARAVDDVWRLRYKPLVLLGHSLGAILAIEVGRTLQSLGVPPAWICVSGRAPPDRQCGAVQHLHELDDDALLRVIMALGGTPDRLLQLPDLRERFLRLLRADLAAVGSYEPASEREPLRCPLTVFSGAQDPWAPAATMSAWERETTGEFRQHLYSGGHFYLLGPHLVEFTQEFAAAAMRFCRPRPGHAQATSQRSANSLRGAR